MDKSQRLADQPSLTIGGIEHIACTLHIETSREPGQRTLLWQGTIDDLVKLIQDATGQDGQPEEPRQ